jgi:hypothetical protein
MVFALLQALDIVRAGVDADQVDLHDLAGVAPGRRSSRRRGLRVGVAGLEPGDALAEAQHCDAVGHRHHLGHVVLISTTAMPWSTLLITSSTR